MHPTGYVDHTAVYIFFRLVTQVVSVVFIGQVDTKLYAGSLLDNDLCARMLAEKPFSKSLQQRLQTRQDVWILQQTGVEAMDYTCQMFS